MNDQLKEFMKVAAMLYDSKPLLDIYSNVMISNGCIRLTGQWFSIVMKHEGLNGVEATLDYPSLAHTLSKMPVVSRLSQPTSGVVSLHGVRDRFDLINTLNKDVFVVRNYSDMVQVDTLYPKDFDMMSQSADMVNTKNLVMCDYIIASEGHFVGVYCEGKSNVSMVHTKRDKKEDTGYIMPYKLAKHGFNKKLFSKCLVSTAMDGNIKTILLNFGYMRVEVAYPNYNGVPQWHNALDGLDGYMELQMSGLIDTQKKLSTYKEYTQLYGVISDGMIRCSMDYDLSEASPIRILKTQCTETFPLIISGKIIDQIIRNIKQPLLRIKYRVITDNDGGKAFIASVNDTLTFCSCLATLSTFKNL